MEDKETIDMHTGHFAFGPAHSGASQGRNGTPQFPPGARLRIGARLIRELNPVLDQSMPDTMLHLLAELERRENAGQATDAAHALEKK